MNHKSDCAVYNEPACPKGRCDCGLLLTPKEVSQIINRSYDDAPWECAESSVEEAIEMQLNRAISWGMI